MTQTNAEQRSEAARLVALHTARAGCWSDDVADSLLSLLPALLADAEALAEREAKDAALELARLVAGPLSRVPVTILVGKRQHTLHYDNAGQVVSGVPDFEGDDGNRTTAADG